MDSHPSQSTEPQSDRDDELPDRVSQLILIHEMPAPGEMSLPQRKGEQCMWCLATAPVELRFLKGMTDWPPRTCDRCLKARAAKVTTYVAWFQHVEACPACLAGPRCETAVPLGEAHGQALEAATSSRDVVCIRCHMSVDVSSPRVMPLHWMGDSSSHNSYIHSPTCGPARHPGQVLLRLVPSSRDPADQLPGEGSE
ncbi:hypothetical protein ACWCV9_34820 [Streptomyces sp. NPDC001606]